MSKADEVFIGLLTTAAKEAMPRADGWEGLPMRLVLKGGEVVEGRPEAMAFDSENAPTRFNTPLDPQEREAFGPVEVTMDFDGKEVLAQEVREFSVRLP